MKGFMISMLAASFVIMLSGCQVVTNLLPTQTPYPTYTPFPTFTPIPSPTSTPENEVLLSLGDFSSSAMCLPQNSENPISNSVQADGYHMELDKSQWFNWSYCALKSYDNVIVEVDAQKLKGGRENDFGIGFRYDTNDNLLYTFTIANNGYYALSIVNEADSTKDYYLLVGGPLDFIMDNQANHLKVIAVKDQIELFVNGQLVGLVHDKTISSGRVGLIIGTFNDAKSEVVFNNFKVSAP